MIRERLTIGAPFRSGTGCGGTHDVLHFLVWLPIRKGCIRSAGNILYKVGMKHAT